MKIKIPLAFKMAAIVFIGTFAIAAAVSIYNGTVYPSMLRQKFAEKIVNMGEFCVYVAEPQMEKLVQGREKDKETTRRYLQNIIEIAVTREDMIYGAIVVEGRVYAKASADGRTNFKLPETRSTGKDMLGYYYNSITGANDQSFEVKFPVEYKGREIGAVLLAYDGMPVKKQITGVTNSSVRIGVGIALLVTLIVFGNLFLFVIGPIKRISIVSEKISKGELPEGVKVTKTGDEIETLTQSFRDMALYVAEIETIIEGLSNGMITEGFKAKSAEDVLGNAVERMLAYFKQISVLMIQISHGDVTGSHTPKSEKDVLGVAVAKMNSTLKKFVEEVKEDSDILSTSAEVLKQISDQSQATIAQLAETVGSISQATAESAKNTQIASQSSVQAREMARQGAARMKQLVDKMQLLNDEIVQSTARMEKLSQHSDEIKKMTIVIKAIADETKLLSFNAAIEAARAGEAGRGFVIVAEEIRKLSDMSTEQAVKISSHIKEVRADIASAIEMVVKESDSIRESAALSSETSALFSDIEKSVDDAADRVTDIAASAQQIAASSEESASASEEQAASMQEINAAVGELNDVSKKMKEETDKYRV